MGDSRKISVRLKQEDSERLQEYCVQTGQDTSRVLRSALNARFYSPNWIQGQVERPHGGCLHRKKLVASSPSTLPGAGAIYGKS